MYLVVIYESFTIYNNDYDNRMILFSNKRWCEESEYRHVGENDNLKKYSYYYNPKFP